MSKEKQWSDYWQNEGKSAEVFVDKSGKKHPGLTEFWTHIFAKFNKKDYILDIASGAGSIFANLTDKTKFNLFAQDISKIALEQQKQRIKNVDIIVSEANKIPLNSEFFQHIVSQFGIEYAGKEAFAEASRLLVNSGTLTFLCHYRGGYIDSKNKAELQGIELIEKTEFIDKGIKIANSLFDNELRGKEDVQEEFITVEKKLEEYVSKNEFGLHCHLFYGLKKLINNYKNYHQRDIINWLKAMDDDIKKSKSRLIEMRKAALSENNINEITEILKFNKINDIEIKSISFNDGQLPVAWCIRGQKQIK
ncbi:MAG: class I SAM-dependent methyltransferase [Gammaproteobacteria bacterium]|nr:class I SAM-dependent methyltransferase [Gammaproteobacteria bacterium]